MVNVIHKFQKIPFLHSTLLRSSSLETGWVERANIDSSTKSNYPEADDKIVFIIFWQ